MAGNQQNIHVLHTLLRDVQKIMKKYYCWGRPIGSTVLWEQHLKTIENICQIVKNIEIKTVSLNRLLCGQYSINENDMIFRSNFSRLKMVKDFEIYLLN